MNIFSYLQSVVQTFYQQLQTRFVPVAHHHYLLDDVEVHSLLLIIHTYSFY